MTKSAPRSTAKRQENTAFPLLRQSSKDQIQKRNGSKNTFKTVTIESGADKANTEDENIDDTHDEIVEPRETTGNNTTKRTTDKKIATNAGLILSTATKRKGRCSSMYNVESKFS